MLIRHGQASFGAVDYDVLSEIGARQAHALGRHWADTGQKIDALYTGPRRRHWGTSRHLLAGARSRDIDYPEPLELPGLDEYPAFELLAHWQPILAAEDVDFQAILAPRADVGERAGERKRRMEKAFHYIVDKWARGELDTGDLESFAHFQSRVRGAIGHIAEQQGRGRTVAAVTSGGPICMALHWALSLQADVAIRQSWVIRNASVSEFRYRDGRAISLFGFNNQAHLHEPELITYR